MFLKVPHPQGMRLPCSTAYGTSDPRTPLDYLKYGVFKGNVFEILSKLLRCSFL